MAALEGQYVVDALAEEAAREALPEPLRAEDCSAVVRLLRPDLWWWCVVVRHRDVPVEHVGGRDTLWELLQNLLPASFLPHPTDQTMDVQ